MIDEVDERLYDWRKVGGLTKGGANVDSGSQSKSPEVFGDMGSIYCFFSSAHAPASTCLSRRFLRNFIMNQPIIVSRRDVPTVTSN